MAMLEFVIQREAFLFLSLSSYTHTWWFQSLHVACCEIWVELNREVKGREAETCPEHEAARPHSEQSSRPEERDKEKRTN